MEVKRKGQRGTVGAEVLKRNTVGEMEWLTFPALEKTGMVRHLFTTRLGGGSEGIFASMNLSYTRGDRKEAVDGNFRRVAKALGCAIEDFVCADQTHTTNIRKVTAADRGKGVTKPKDYQDTDGLITNEAGVVLVTFYADCVPSKGGDKYLLDLWKANFYVFTEAGVPAEQISVTDICTCCNPDYLFSHRASQGKRGNMGAFLGLAY